VNKKAQVQIGALITLAIALIVGLVLIADGISEPIAAVTQTTTVSNVTYTAPAAAGSSINLVGQAYTNVIVTNATSGTLIPASNYTITNRVVNNGMLVTTLTANAGNSLGWHGKGINVSATVEPFGYDTNSGNRAIISLILVLAAIALVAASVAVVMKNSEFIFN
jgi:hypothetical protein